MRNAGIRNTVLSGVSGEYFVAAELSKRGYIASITLRNTKGVDILCSNSEASKTVGIQVKTNSGSKEVGYYTKKPKIILLIIYFMFLSISIIIKNTLIFLLYQAK